jgi:hypothetical protein
VLLEVDERASDRWDVTQYIRRISDRSVLKLQKFAFEIMPRRSSIAIRRGYRRAGIFGFG